MYMSLNINLTPCTLCIYCMVIVTSYLQLGMLDLSIILLCINLSHRNLFCELLPMYACACRQGWVDFLGSLPVCLYVDKKNFTSWVHNNMTVRVAAMGKYMYLTVF